MRRGKKRNRKDSRATVEVRAILRGRGNYPVRGNIVRSFTVHNGRVSQVIERCRKACGQ